MNAVQRARGVKRIIRRFVLNRPAQKFVIAGDRACRERIRRSVSRRQSGPSDFSILAWASYDLSREIRNGFWEFRAA